jgi:hypothetical protein
MRGGERVVGRHTVTHARDPSSSQNIKGKLKDPGVSVGLWRKIQIRRVGLSTVSICIRASGTQDAEGLAVEIRVESNSTASFEVIRQAVLHYLEGSAQICIPSRPNPTSWAYQTVLKRNVEQIAITESGTLLVHHSP